MRKIYSLLVVMVVGGMIISSCKSKNEVGKLIPVDAITAGYIDAGNILQKLPWDSIKATHYFKAIQGDAHVPEWFKPILDNPEKSGININKGIVIYGLLNKDKKINIAIAGFISSSKDFEAFNKNLDAKATPAHEKEFSIMSLRNKVPVAWNNDHFIYTVSINSISDGLGRHTQFDNDEDNEDPEIDLQSGINFIRENFELSSGKSLAKESRFIRLLEEDSDVAVWVNSEKIMDAANLGMMNLLSLEKLVKDSRRTYSINFEDGKVTSRQRGYYGKEMTNLIKKHMGQKLKSSEFTAIPSSDIIAAFGAVFQPEAIPEFTKLLGIDGLINAGAGQLGIKIDDLIKGLDGKFIGAVSDVKVNTIKVKSPKIPDDSVLDGDAWRMLSESGMTLVPDFTVLFSAGVKDKTSLQKVVDPLQKLIGQAGENVGLDIELTDKNLVVSNKKEFTTQFLKGEKTKETEWMKKLAGHTSGLYVDINKIISKIPESKDTAINAVKDLSLHFWKDFYQFAGTEKDNSFSSEFELNLIDNKRNSLRQFNQYIDQIYLLSKGKLKNWEKNKASGSATTVYPPLSNPDLSK